MMNLGKGTESARKNWLDNMSVISTVKIPCFIYFLEEGERLKHPDNEFDFEIVVSDDSSDSLYEALLKDSIEQLILSGFEVSDARIAFGRCPLCGQKIDIRDFVDDLSLREYGISGMCQSCQDDVFGKDDKVWS